MQAPCRVATARWASSSAQKLPFMPACRPGGNRIQHPGFGIDEDAGTDRRFVGPSLFFEGRAMPVSETNDEVPPPLIATGIPGLDDILAGGFTPNRIYLVEG